MTKKIIIAIVVLFAWAPWINNQRLYDKVFEERAVIDGTVDKYGNLVCDYSVMWVPFGRYVASCEGGYFVSFLGRILFYESPDNIDGKCAWKINKEELEKLGLHCSMIAGYYYGPAIVGMPSDEHECNPVAGCEFNSEIVPFETMEECVSSCPSN